MKRKNVPLDEIKQMLGEFINVKNATSRNGMATAPNQFIIIFENGKALKSYDTYVAAIIGDEKWVGSEHGHSRTTSRFVGDFLGMYKDERERAIKNETINHFIS